MATITTRAGKGSPLTNDEVDANFTNLNTDKAELSGASFTGNVSFGDNDKAVFGAGSDLQIYHDGSHSYVKDAGTGILYVQGSAQVRVGGADGTTGVEVNEGGDVKLRYNNANKLATTSTGIDVTGSVVSDGLTVDGIASVSSTNPKIQLFETDTTDLNTQIQNQAGDFKVSRLDDDAGSLTVHFEIDHSTGNVSIPSGDLDVTGEVRSDSLKVDGGTNTEGLTAEVSGFVTDLTIGGITTGSDLRFSYNRANGLTTISEGTRGSETNIQQWAANGDISFYEDTGTTAKLTWDASAETLNFADNGKAVFGAGSDLQIYHDGTGSYIEENGTGNLFIEATNLRIKSASGENYIAADQDGAVTLYNDNTARLATTSSGIDVTGTAVTDGLTSDGVATVRVTSAGATAEALTVYNTSNTNNSQVDVYFGSNDYDTAGRGLRIEAGRDSGADGIATFYSVDQAEHSDYEAIKILTDGGVTLSHLGSNKLATTSTGIDVTGDISATDATPSLNLYDSDNSTRTNLTNNTGTSYLTAFGTSTGSYGTLIISSSNHTTTQEFIRADNTNIQFKTNATLRGRFLSNGDYVLYNDAATSTDFYWDASTSRLGLGTTAPSRALTVDIGIDNEGIRIVSSDSFALYESVDSGGTVAFGSAAGDAVFRIGGNNVYQYDTSASAHILRSASSEAMRVTSTGIDVTGEVRSNSLKVDGGTNTEGLTAEVSGVVTDLTIGGISTGADLRFSYNRGNGSTTISEGTRGSETNLQQWAGNGDISFYNSAGTSQDLFWDAGTSRLGLGTTSPSTLLHLSASSPRITLTDTDTGADHRINADSTAGNLSFDIDINSETTSPAYVVNMKGSEKFRISSTGAIDMTGDSIDGTSESSLFFRNRVNGGSVRLGVETTGGTLYYPVLMNGTSDILTFNNAEGEMARFTTDGKLGLGTSAPAGRLEVNSGTAANTAYITSDVAATRLIFRNSATGASDTYRIEVNSTDLYYTANQHIFRDDAFAEVGRFDASGNLLVGLTSSNYLVADDGIQLNANGTARFGASGTTARNLLSFVNGTDGTPAEVGTIQTNGSSTSYNTSSDQRLKENIVDAPSASDDIDAIQVRSFDWKTDGSHQKYGMVAQELQSVAPDAVSEGDTEEDMMGVDYSKLVPMMLKEIQSLRARVAQLEGAN